MSDGDPRGLGPGELRELLREEPGRRRLTRRRPLQLLATVLPGAAALAVAAGLWQLVAAHNPDTFASIPAIFDALKGDLSSYGIDTAVTLEEVAIGLAVSFAVAFLLAVAMTYSVVAERAVMPLAVILNVTPIVAIAPSLALVLGLGMLPRYTVTALIVFFPLLVNCLVGLGSVDGEALEVFRTLDASHFEILFRLRLPSSLPYLFVAARIAFPLAVIGAVVAEFSTSGAQRGLGYAIYFDTSQPGQIAFAYAALFCLAVLGLVLTAVVTFAERRFLVWHASGNRRAGTGER